MKLNKWDFVVVSCVLILVFYTIFVTIGAMNDKNEYCSSLCEVFNNSVKEVRGSYCICDNGISYPMYDLEAYSEALSK